MPANISSLTSTDSLTTEDVARLFKKAEFLKGVFSNSHQGFQVKHSRPRVVATMFLEPSTRTRLSFEFAAHRLGIQVANFGDRSASSVTKGETPVDTLRNIVAMQPDALVIRYGVDVDLDSEIQTLSIPVINAGSGISAHPTQALLDAFTIHREMGGVAGQRVLIVGDIMHGRVAQSNMELLPRLGAEVAVCAPDQWALTPTGVTRFPKLADGIKWATVIMALRIQRERHQELAKEHQMQEYLQRYSITGSQLKGFSEKGILLHPGPVNIGVELDSQALADKRNKILEQVNNGVWIRASILADLLKLDI